MGAPHHRELRRLILFLDAGLIVLSMMLAFNVHAALRAHLPFLKDPVFFSESAMVVYLTAPLWLILLGSHGLHRIFDRRWRWTELVTSLLKVHLQGLAGLALLMLFTQARVNRSMVALFLAFTFLLLLLERVAIHSWLEYQHSSGQGRRRLLLVGRAGAKMAAFVEAMKAEDRPPEILGYLSPEGEDGDSPGSPVRRLGDVLRLDQVLHDEAVDWVFFLPPFSEPSEVRDLLDICQDLGVPVGFSFDRADVDLPPPRVLTLYHQSLITFSWSPGEPDRLALKHGLEWIAAALGLVLLSPLFLLIGLAILVTSGRPIFFTQERVGLFGRRFQMYKFRTMEPDAEKARADLEELNQVGGPIFKADPDPRVTRLGRFLRRTSLDELPQLWNVFKGSMSIVGPRPLPTMEQQEIRGAHRRRLSMKPGITGLWQVSGRSDLDFETTMALDLEYVDTWSPWNDLRILIKTMPVVLSGKGAR